MYERKLKIILNANKIFKKKIINKSLKRFLLKKIIGILICNYIPIYSK